MFEVGYVVGFCVLGLLVIVPLSLLGLLGCKIFGIPVRGSLWHEPGVPGPALSWRLLARTYALIPYLVVVAVAGFIVGI